jgi:peptide methionine sulfoxide reductase msrA/msrB
MKATFAGGCFWCMVAPFENAQGIISVVSGYCNGTKPNPTYQQVISKKYMFVEAVQIEYDQKKIPYGELLDIFWRNIDPTDEGGQFADRGIQYQTAIFYHDENQRRLAEQSKRKIAKQFERPIMTRLIPFENFYPAEDYHQDYHKKNPIRYAIYKRLSGREGFLKRLKDG